MRATLIHGRPDARALTNKTRQQIVGAVLLASAAGLGVFESERLPI